MHGMVSMEHNGTIVLQNKIEKRQRTGKGVVSIKMKKFIHGFKFMPKMNWMQYFILSFQAKVRNQLNSDRIFREIWKTNSLGIFFSSTSNIPSSSSSFFFGKGKNKSLVFSATLLKSFLPLSSLECHEDTSHSLRDLSLPPHIWKVLLLASIYHEEPYVDTKQLKNKPLSK